MEAERQETERKLARWIRAGGGDVQSQNKKAHVRGKHTTDYYIQLL